MESKDKSPANRPSAKPPANPEMEDFFARFHEQMTMAKPGEAPLATAMHALRELSLESDSEESAEHLQIPSTPITGPTCAACGAHNREGNRFCSSCGIPLASAKEGEAKAGQHFYHHHYHHHYVSGNGIPSVPSADVRGPSTAGAPKDFVRARVPATGAFLSRTETALRQVTQNWALACNTKQIDDLMELYTADALVLRPNVPPIRGTASVREFFVSALGSGLGEVEMDALRVEIFGDAAYEAGRCKMLVPSVAGKRREERGKYLLFMVRQAEGEWKIVVDCWSTDLGLEK
jgi:ketosteroid isomerase-like protein